MSNACAGGSYEASCNDCAIHGDPMRDHYDYEANAVYDRFDGCADPDLCADMDDCPDDEDCADPPVIAECAACDDYDDEVPF